MRRRLYQLAVIVVCLVIIQGLSRGLIELSAQDRRLGRARSELGKLKQKEVELKRQLEYFRSDEYVEKIARDKLLMAKEGETVLLLPEQQNGIFNFQFSPVPFGTGRAIFNDGEEKGDLPNWQKWARLFGF